MGLIELIAAVTLVFINLALFMDLKRIHEEQKETRRILVRIKTQLNKQENLKPRPTPAPVTTYSYSVYQKDSGFYFTIKDKGEDVYKGFVYGTRLKATKAAQELIKAYTNREKEG